MISLFATAYITRNYWEKDKRHLTDLSFLTEFSEKIYLKKDYLNLKPLV